MDDTIYHVSFEVVVSKKYDRYNDPRGKAEIEMDIPAALIDGLDVTAFLASVLPMALSSYRRQLAEVEAEGAK